jgi:hypothetical protein
MRVMYNIDKSSKAKHGKTSGDSCVIEIAFPKPDQASDLEKDIKTSISDKSLYKKFDINRQEERLTFKIQKSNAYAGKRIKKAGHA